MASHGPCDSTNKDNKVLSVTTAVALSGAITLGSVPQAQAATVGYVRKVTALGDSYPAGSMGNEGNSYVERYGRRTGQRPLNHARGGWRTSDVLYMSANSPVTLRNVRDTRTVIITIGANDIAGSYRNPSGAANSVAAYQPALDKMRGNLNKVLWHVSKARGGANGRVVVTTYNSIYTDGSHLTAKGSSYARGAENLTRAVNSIILSSCARYKMACVDVYPAFNVSSVDSLVNYDGTHPSSKGHQLYADKIYARVR